MSESKHTKGPWEVALYGLEPEMIEKQRQLGIEPTRILTNDGQAPVMAGSGDDKERIALVDCQASYRRGQGYKAECAERDANARLIAAAPDLLESLEDAMRWVGSLTDWAGAGDPDVEKWRAAIAKAKGEK